MTAAPHVSVLVLTHNHAPYVEQCLDSVLAEDYPDLDLVITDDASSDGTPDVIRAWLARTGVQADFVAQDRNAGVCATINGALARATGELVCMISGDDWYDADHLARLVPVLVAQDDDVAAVYSDARQVGPDGTLISASHIDDVLPGQPAPDGWIFDDVHRTCFPSVMAVLMRRSAIDAVGGFDETLVFEDWDLWLRLADRYRFRHVGGVVASRRLLPTSMFHAGFETPAMQRSVARVHEKWLDRDDTARRTSALWMRRAAHVISREDRREALAILRRLHDVPAIDEYPWHAFEAALTVPGAGRLLPRVARAKDALLRVVLAERNAWRSGRRLGPAHREAQAQAQAETASP